MPTHYAAYVTTLCTAVASAHVSAIVRSFGPTVCAALISTKCTAVDATFVEAFYSTIDGT